ncbi:MAG: TonB-dependent receptor [Nevskiaceae bacterium]|nr:TonB-dependent receptor [Nevskiaceae bacterium]
MSVTTMNSSVRAAASKGSGLVCVAVVAAICGVTPTFAVAQEEADEISEVVVTGSRVIREGMSSPTPVTSLSSAELLQANPQSIVQALATLPSMSGSTTPKTIGGRTTLGPGNFLNLRNLGTNRNLVLLDGRRLVPANIAGNTDINLLPQGLIENVSVVTGGASAAYGSDAVAGVTNFILNKRFQGFKADVNYGESAHGGDGATYKIALAGGESFFDGRLHLIGSFDWHNSKQAYKENRNWANRYCALIPVPGVTAATMSPSDPRQTIACGVTQPTSSYGGAIISGPLVTANEGITFGSGGVPEAFTYGTLRSANLQVGGEGNFIGDTANFNTPTDNKVFFTHALFHLTDNVEFFAQATVANAKSVYTQTPPFFQGSTTNQGTALRIFSGNPFIPASIQSRMNTQGVANFDLGLVAKSWGNIDIESRYQAWDGALGLQGKFGNGWNWDMHYQQGRTSFRLGYMNQLSLEHVHRAVDAVLAPNGTVVCQSALVNPAAYGDCVPLNPFGDPPSQAALDYIHTDAQPWNYNIMRQRSAGANINGEPFSSWAGPVAIGAGVEYRELEGEILSDSVSNTIPSYADVRGLPPAYVGRVGGWSTSNVQPTSGKYDVKEAYVEALVPLAKDLPWAQSLDLNAAVRYTDYSQSGSVETWKVGLTWRPFDELLLRGTRSRDIRAPGIGDLYTKDSQGPNTIVIDRVLPNAPSVSVPIILSGNPALKPETADTTTFGFTYQPDWLSGFGASLDYYDIRIKDTLAAATPADTIDRCVLGQQIYCDNLIRTGTALVAIRQSTMNLSEARTKGVDLDFSYRTLLAGVNTSFRLIGTRLLEQSTTVPSATSRAYSDRVGDMGQGYPKWQVNFMANADVGALGFNVNARYIGSGKYNSTYLPGDIAPQYAEVGSLMTFDVGARYRFENSRGSPELYVNVANLFDRNPPLMPSSALVGGQTNVSLYDTIGRFYAAGVRAQF